MKTFPLILQDNHPIIKDGGNLILVDTGSPTTIHINNKFQFIDKNFNVTTSVGGFSIDRITQGLGCKITTLLGNDIIRNYKLLFNYEEAKITFFERDEEPIISGKKITLSSISGIPTFKAKVNFIENNEIEFFLDSGARLSYLREDLTTDLKKHVDMTDFYPGYGSFTVPTFLTKIYIDQVRIDPVFANLPKQLARLTNTVPGIMGSDLFRERLVFIDLKANLMII